MFFFFLHTTLHFYLFIYFLNREANADSVFFANVIIPVDCNATPISVSCFHLTNNLTTYTLGKSSNRSARNFNILTKLSNIQKFPLFQTKVIYFRRDLSKYHFDRSIFCVSMAKQR